MSGPREKSIRNPAVAGTFYPGQEKACRTQAQGYLQPLDEPAISGKKWVGAVVPHAGWTYSGALAGEAIATLARQGQVDLVVVFGAVHTPLPLKQGALDDHQIWEVPTGQSQLSRSLTEKLVEQVDYFILDSRFHQREHAIEVEVPLIQLAWPQAQLLPIEVPPGELAVEIGQKTARMIKEEKLSAVYLASSDLTHYGPPYGFTPAGLGLSALQWAKENDQRLLRLITSLSGDQIVNETRSRMNACGGGAIAALIGACRELGAAEGRVLRHVHSFDAQAAAGAKQLDLSVGYANVLLG